MLTRDIYGGGSSAISRRRRSEPARYDFLEPLLEGGDPLRATPPFDRADGAATFLDEDEDEAFFLTDWSVERKADVDVVEHLSLFEVRVAGRAWSPIICD